jgi:hypothetical protein
VDDDRKVEMFNRLAASRQYMQDASIRDCARALVMQGLMLVGPSVRVQLFADAWAELDSKKPPRH